MVCKKQCTGCGACASVCPHNAIKIVQGKDGFSYPLIDKQKCTKCGLCDKVCPVELPNVKSKCKQAFAAIIKDEYIRLKSSSGGMFSALSENIINNGGAVFGAGFDENFTVRHMCAEDMDGIEKLRGSKYVQSDIGESFRDIKSLLKQHRTVMFVGTPCQVAGLKSYLGKEYDNLITVDLICHGVPSPVFWKKYIEYREKVAEAKTQKIFFRHKKNGWKIYSVQFIFDDCTEYIQSLTKDLYMKGFLSNLFLRDSCYKCKFKNDNYYSDITLADFWGIDKIMPDINDNKGVSLVLANTEKGLDEISKTVNCMDLYKVDTQDALRGNISYYESVEYTPLQRLALFDTERLEFDILIDKYCGLSLPKRMLRKTCRTIAKIFKM